MAPANSVWALILAAGEGNRLRALTTTSSGMAVPKQFCSLSGGQTLLEDAMARARGVVAPHRICTIVAQQHRQWWSDLLQEQPARNVIVQPRNRGTGVGIFYAALHIAARNPHARILLLPADHYVRDEQVLQQSLSSVLSRSRQQPDHPVLLGLEPESVDTELGYVVPGARDRCGLQIVRRFIEKPGHALASEIIEAGALWNTFIIVASVGALINLFMRRYAALALEMQVIVSHALNAGSAGAGWPAVVDLYERLPSIDFSRDLLEGGQLDAEESVLRVEQVPACGWSDLGTPHRVAETLRRLLPANQSRHARATPFIDLAARHASTHALAERSSAR